MTLYSVSLASAQTQPSIPGIPTSQSCTFSAADAPLSAVPSPLENSSSGSTVSYHQAALNEPRDSASTSSQPVENGGFVYDSTGPGITKFEGNDTGGHPHNRVAHARRFRHGNVSRRMRSRQLPKRTYSLVDSHEGSTFFE